MLLTPFQKRIMAEYTEIAKIDDHFVVRFKSGVQSFDVRSLPGRDRAIWYREQLAIALANMINKESE